jgi:putative ABC transport system permease protein
MNDVVRGSLGIRRFTMAVLSIFPLVATVLAVVGLYGVIAYAVAQRIPELGVRLALGATSRQIVTLVLGDALWLLLLGVAAGGARGAVVAHSMSRLLFGIAPFDPSVFLTAAVVLVAVGLLAGGMPARRAARVDPVVALRSE